MLKVDTKFTYRHPTTYRNAYCRIRVYLHEGKQVVVATELDDGLSISTTAAVERLATAVVNAYDLDFDRLIWIEHYPANSELGLPETFELVRFDWLEGKAKHITWEQLIFEEVERLTGDDMITSD